MAASSRRGNRRTFLAQTSAIGAGIYFASGSPVRSAPDRPLNRLNVAVVGAEGKGSSDCDNAADAGAHIVALCDIDDLNLKKKGKRYPEARQFNDYREMLDTMGDQIDAVTVSTPDHTHAVASVAAMRKGKHVYCQKPLTWSIFEARRMREIARETGVVTQMGNQGTTENGLREAVEVVRAGAIGDIREVHVWTNRPVWKQGIPRPAPAPIPPHVHWDLFLGPAPERPYSPAYHPFSWRGWFDFGTGALGDMACHTANMPVMALDLFEPQAFQAVTNSGVYANESYPDSSIIRFEFGSRGNYPACTLTWYDGGNIPDESVLSNTEVPTEIAAAIAKDGRKSAMGSGCVLIGSKGKMYSPGDYCGHYFLLPEKDFAGYQKPAPTLPRLTVNGNSDQRHMAEFLAACRGEGKTLSNFDYAGRLTETILCGNLALRSEKRIEWDAVKLVSPNCPELNQYVNRENRKGFEL